MVKQEVEREAAGDTHTPTATTERATQTASQGQNELICEVTQLLVAIPRTNSCLTVYESIDLATCTCS